MKSTTLHPASKHQVQSQEVKPSYIKWFREIGIEDVPLVGGKTASLGEMFRELAPQGVKVPDGFAITAAAYWHLLRETRLDQFMETQLLGLDANDVKQLQRSGAAIRDAFLAAKLPIDLRREILEAYDLLCQHSDAPISVAVRSSATAEDLPEASFAGAQETFLNVVGADRVIEACRRCYASLFTDRAISYRAERKFAHDKVGLSIAVQTMVHSDVGSSGVIFTIDTETGFRDAVLINASYGLGENVVKGFVNPDEFCVFKPTLKSGFRPILQKVAGSKELKLVYDNAGAGGARNIPVPPQDRRRFSISDDEILQLARWACVIEEHYSTKNGRPTPMDVEFAKDGRTGDLFILQARPETVESRKDTAVIEQYRLKSRGLILIRGRSVGTKIASGAVRVIADLKHLDDFQEGEILVADKTDPDWEPIMKKAAAIVTNRGGRTCHAAIVSRELGVPAIVGTEHGTELLRNGQSVTVSCAQGDIGFVFEGKLPFEVQRTNLKDLPRPRTKVMMNIANPEEAFALSFIPNDGVGLAREEFIISNYIRVHPLALIDYAKINDPAVKANIDKLTAGYDDKPQFFVDKLAQGVAMIAAAFYPKDVIVRLSDFKTNEYANLIGGHPYEPVEENPMLGFRGASRYYNERYRAGFALECRAIKKVREEMGLTNVKLMIPFCRTVDEGRKVLAELEKHSLKRGDANLEVYVMCEIPSNVILANEFAEIFDGFSIGSNDLTQLVLGVDRDSQIVAGIFDERNAAVKKMIAQVIAAAHAKNRKIGICGQAPSDYPEFVQFLVERGIDSISLNADTVTKTTMAILEKEEEQGQLKEERKK
ncbi:MAG TPA: phosphoenolpyruvate synthase [Candidatus Udaeobacter sp.]|nr:phosphoenolpyruvate synthase [Candidatus Udaeobacter sp.]